MNHLADIIVEYFAKAILRLIIVVGAVSLIVGVAIGYFTAK